MVQWTGPLRSKYPMPVQSARSNADHRCDLCGLGILAGTRFGVVGNKTLCSNCVELPSIMGPEWLEEITPKMHLYKCCMAYGPWREDHLCWGKCCQEAKPLGCVCAYAFTCPVHGERHYGTHD